MGPYELNIKRGLIAGLVAGALAFAGPWLLLHLLLFTQRLGSEIDPSPDGARLASYFLASIVGTAACVSFCTKPRSSVRHDFIIVACLAILIPSLWFLVEGPRLKSEPPFGEKPTDIVLLTVPAVASGILLLAWRTLRKSRSTSAMFGEPTRKQP